MEQFALLVMITSFVAAGEGVTSQGTPYLPGDTVIDVVAHGEAAMALEACLDLAETVRPTLPAPAGLAEGTEVLAVDVACVALPPSEG
jgi:hypothetical protein